jgi:GNAT superfamily N-acetyltransferase
MPIRYRFVSPEKWPTIKDNVLKLDMPFWKGTELAADEAFYTEVFTNPRAITYVAEDNGTFIGFINCVPAQDFAKWFREDDGSLGYNFEKIGENSSYVHGIAVNKSYWGTDIGNNLLLLAIKDSKLRGYDTMSAYCKHGTSKGMLYVLGKENLLKRATLIDFDGVGNNFEFGIIDISSFQDSETNLSKAMVPYKK